MTRALEYYGLRRLDRVLLKSKQVRSKGEPSSADNNNSKNNDSNVREWTAKEVQIIGTEPIELPPNVPPILDKARKPFNLWPSDHFG